MKKSLILIAFLALGAMQATAQDDVQKAAAEAAKAIAEAPKEAPAPVKPNYWKHSLLTNLNFTQTSLTNWAAGGYNTYTLAAYVDGNANYKREKMIWNNRLQMDYGFLYSEDKPILQKSKDRIYLESKWGYETPIRHLSYSASFDFKTQFDRNWTYKTPAADGTSEPTKEQWLAARDLKSALFSPAYINLGIGLLWTPKKWLSVNFAPFTGGLVIVDDPLLRYTYGMELRDPDAYADAKAAFSAGDYTAFKPLRFELGAQLKADAKFVINDNVNYTTQVALFYNYLEPKRVPRINWDNKLMWKLMRFFALTFSTNLIYDQTVLVKDSDGDKVMDKTGVQFKEFLEFGFSYTIGAKKK
ncbi:MAG: DUF3078 domain-containing protein [Bacteroidales bacterium]|nr:DUF3078 domain-containing protein [Bacteroidales bacterium]